MLSDIFDNILKIRLNCMITVSDGFDICVTEILLAFFVINDRFFEFMLATVNFNRKSNLRTIEIQDVRSYTILPPKLIFCKLTVAKFAPQKRFSFRLMSAKFSPTLFENRIVIYNIHQFLPLSGKREARREIHDYTTSF